MDVTHFAAGHDLGVGGDDRFHQGGSGAGHSANKNRRLGVRSYGSAARQKPGTEMRDDAFGKRILLFP